MLSITIGRQKKNCKFTFLFMKGMTDRQTFSPASQLALLLALTGAGFIFGSFAVLGVQHVLMPLTQTGAKNHPAALTNVDVTRLLQVVGTLFLFILPAALFSFLTNRAGAAKYLGFNTVISTKQLLLVVVMFFASFFVSGALEIINQNIPLTKNLATTFKHWEDEYNKQAEMLGTIRSGGEYVLALFMLALLPAVAEEMLFRGCLQKVIIGLSRNAFTGILITAVLFSLMHGSFYGFLVRVFLGGILGFIYYYSKNLWLNITLHFLNNAFVVTEMYAISKKAVSPAADAVANNIPATTILLMGVGAMAALQFLFKLFQQESEVVIAMHAVDDAPTSDHTNNAL